METYVALLQSYGGRDKIIRTTAYACSFIAANTKGKPAKDLAAIATSISAARTVLRLFDDLPMLLYTLKWSEGERDPVTKLLSNLGNLSILLYFPCEKIAWSSNQEILPFKSEGWIKGGIAFWAGFLFFNILKGLRQLSIIKYKRAKIQKQRKLESPDRSGDELFRQQLKDLAEKEVLEYWTLVKNIGDIIMAVNWLPEGFLWANKIGPAKTMFSGLVSSAVGLYLLAKAHNQSKAKSS